MDVLAFTGGIGEHDALLRQQVCEALTYLGVHIDLARNNNVQGDRACVIHSAQTTVDVWVIHTDEGRVAAQDALTLL